MSTRPGRFFTVFVALAYLTLVPALAMEPQHDHSEHAEHQEHQQEHAEHDHAEHQEHEPADHDAHKHAGAMEHSFEDVDRYVKMFESSDRVEWQMPGRVVDEMGLSAGMAVADVGAGTGYFVEEIAARVGASGVLYASDLEPAMVVHLRQRAEKAGMDNLVPVLASMDDPRLPDGGVDVIFICDTWHHIGDKVAYARRLTRDLRPGGRVVIVDFVPGELPVGPPAGHGKLSADEVTAQFKEAGYRQVASKEFLPYQYYLVFTPEG